MQSNTRQWVDAKHVKWLIEIPGSPEKRGPMIVTEEWRPKRSNAGKIPELSVRDSLLATLGFTSGVAVTFFVLIGSTLFNNAVATVAAAL